MANEPLLNALVNDDLNAFEQLLPNHQNWNETYLLRDTNERENILSIAIKKHRSDYVMLILDHAPHLLKSGSSLSIMPLKRLLIQIRAHSSDIELYIIWEVIRHHILKELRPYIFDQKLIALEQATVQDANLQELIKAQLHSYVDDAELEPFLDQYLASFILSRTVKDIGFKALAHMAHCTPHWNRDLSPMQLRARDISVFYDFFKALGGFEDLSGYNAIGLSPLLATFDHLAIQLLMQAPNIEINAQAQIEPASNPPQTLILNGQTLLHRAVSDGDQKLVSAILADSKINPNLRDEFNNLAIAYFGEKGGRDMPEMFIELVDNLDFKFDEIIDFREPKKTLLEKLQLSFKVLDHQNPSMMARKFFLNDRSRQRCIHTYTIAMVNEAAAFYTRWHSSTRTMDVEINDYFIKLAPNLMTNHFPENEAESLDQYLSHFTAQREIIKEGREYRQVVEIVEALYPQLHELEQINLIFEYAHHEDSLTRRMNRLWIDIIAERAKQAVLNSVSQPVSNQNMPHYQSASRLGLLDTTLVERHASLTHKP